MGRNATGVKAIELEEDERVIGAASASSESEQILVVTEFGYGKRTLVDEYRVQARGGKGVKTIELTEKRGKLAKLLSVKGDEDLFVITDKGMTIRTPINQIAQSGRATQGVKIIDILEGQQVMTITLLPHEDEEEEEELPVEAPVEAEIKEENDKSDDIF